jgi:hypothetical protein
MPIKTPTAVAIIKGKPRQRSRFMVDSRERIYFVKHFV